MSESPHLLHITIAELYQQHARRVFATLVHLLSDFDLAEEALHEAYQAALEQWPVQGIPDHPVAWLVSAGRYKAIDSLRRLSRFDSLDQHTELIERLIDESAQPTDADALEDDRLRLIFTCCHPALASDAQVALTLREVCGLSTEQIAHAFLIPATTLAQRIVRAKAKIRAAKIPYQVPDISELPTRLNNVLKVIYLVFNEAYSASAGMQALHQDLACEAIRVARLLHDLLPEPEVKGLLALMLLHESRRPARTDSAGDLIALEAQDRCLWNPVLIAEGLQLTEQALRSRRFGVYTLQAAISAVHAEAVRYEHTDWRQIVGLYDVLLRMENSHVIQLNRAMALAMCGDCQSGLDMITHLLQHEDMQSYHLAHAAQADLFLRTDQREKARQAYLRALSLCQQEPERRFLERKMAETER